MLIKYILRRIAWSIPILFVVSLLSFLIIQAPPGDFITAHTAALVSDGQEVSYERIQALRQHYGLDESLVVQYWKWISGVLVGDFGLSFEWREPVSSLIWERMGLSTTLAAVTVLFTWAVALPIGVYSAVKKYTFGDYVVTTIGFLGLATPNFLLALILMYVSVVYFGLDVSGLFSTEYKSAPWSWGKVQDLIAHLWIPVIILGTSSTASIIRVLRANLLDELHKPYVTTARAKGLSELTLLVRYPVRIALNPFISTIGWIFPQIVSGSVIVSIVLSLPTAGPMYLTALKSQDMFLAGSFVLMLSVLAVVGMLISDILLGVIDPRIRLGK